MSSKTLTIYHGSANIIPEPKFGAGNPRNDYGLGFYCTETLDLAKEWACTETHGGYANKYFLEMKDLNILNLSGKKYTILHWLTILLQNRLFERRNQISELGRQYLIDHFSIDTSVYDVIKGYRADDSYFSFAQDFLDNTITLKKLSEAMKLGKLGEQIVIISRDGYKHLHYAGAEPVDKDIYYPRKKARDELARSTYFQSRINIELTADDLFLADIIRRGMTANDIHI